MNDSVVNLSRRGFVVSAALAGMPQLVKAEKTAPPEPPAGPSNPYTYHFKIGEVDAWTISDAYFPIREGLGLMWPEESREEMKGLLSREGRETDSIPLYANVLLLRKDKEIILFDAGFGGSNRRTVGWLRHGLAQIGITPEQVTAGFLSHAHSDHLNGFVAEDRAAFPNAAFYLRQEELDFWQGKDPDFSKSKRNKKSLPGMIKTVRKNFEILGENTKLVKDGDELFGGLVRVEAAPGHTSGHSCFRIRSAGEELLHLMDLAHHDLLMFADPNWTIAFDHDPKLAVVTRKKYWEQAAAQGTRCYGFHLPWPGLGYIVQQGRKYRWAAEPWRWA
ncbi:MAG: MBL fold metallo-hydrolase [Verrucomicrobiota bacterium JB023]|nr:MBL fold metallo-hydrolase [Verrucomicrobiota bacterium JB023]